MCFSCKIYFSLLRSKPSLKQSTELWITFDTTERHLLSKKWCKKECKLCIYSCEIHLIIVKAMGAFYTMNQQQAYAEFKRCVSMKCAIRTFSLLKTALWTIQRLNDVSFQCKTCSYRHQAWKKKISLWKVCILWNVVRILFLLFFFHM